jgi:hypothetical protein
MLTGIVTEIFKQTDGTTLIRLSLNASETEIHKAVGDGVDYSCADVEGARLVEACSGVPGFVGPFAVLRAPGNPQVTKGQSITIGACPLKKSMSAEDKLNALAKEMQENLLKAAPTCGVTFAKAFQAVAASHPALWQQMRREKLGF